jgi:hypothetical protein
MQFESFAQFASTLLGEQGSQYLKPGQRYQYKTGRGVMKIVAVQAIIDNELHNIGFKLREYYRNRLTPGTPENEEARSEWPDLNQNTVKKRVRAGFSPNNPLYETGALANAIDYDVKSHFEDDQSAAAQVGIVEGEHQNPWGNQTIDNATLGAFMEYGTPLDDGSRMPARPIFTGDDWPDVEEKYIKEFEQAVIGQGILKRLLS